VPESDHLTLINVYNQWKFKRYSNQWCKENFLSYKGLKRAREVNQQLGDIVNSVFKRYNIPEELKFMED
ncbi:MAG: hypothetical protein MHPSP_004129, partial [Paramarteilia canceri]